MREKLMRFMQGRYGVDQFSRFLTYVTLGVILLSSLFRWTIFYWLGIALFVYAYFRIFSKNVSKRYMENEAYMQYSRKVRSFLSKQKAQLKDRKVYHIYRCPSCKQKIRIPKGKGKIEVTCPKCRTAFIKRS